MDDTEFFRIMIESVEPKDSFFQTFWTSAHHTGEAIDRVLKACTSLGIRNAIAREADFSDFNSLPENAVRDKKLNVFYTQGRIYFPTEESFIAPFGIIKSALEGEHDYALIKEGFFTETEGGIYEVEAAIERDKLLNTFVELVNLLPSIKVFWIKLAADWEDKGLEEFWINEALNTVDLIESFLRSHREDTIANGHVALTAYGSVGETNLSIDTHKTIKVLTKSASIQGEMAAALLRLGFEELSEFHSLEYRYYHWHYRPAQSMPRTRLVAALKRDGFTLWRSQAPEVDDDLNNDSLE